LEREEKPLITTASMKKVSEGAAVRAEAADSRPFERSRCFHCSGMMSSMDRDAMKFLDATTVRRNEAVAKCCSDVRRFMCTQSCTKPEKEDGPLILDDGDAKDVEKRR
jgi:hypothetical protein